MPADLINNIVRTTISAEIVIPPPPLTFEFTSLTNDSMARVRCSIKDIPDATLREIGKRYGEMLIELSHHLHDQPASGAQKAAP